MAVQSASATAARIARCCAPASAQSLFELCVRHAAAPDLVDRELVGLWKLKASRGQRGLQAAVARLLPGVLRFPDLTDAKVRPLTEQGREAGVVEATPRAHSPEEGI